MSTLVKQNSLVTALVELLNQCQGCASYQQIAREIFYFTEAEADLTRQLLGSLLEADQRFAFQQDWLELLPDLSEQRALADATFVVVDVETTGAQAQQDRITEIAAYKIVRGQIIGEFSSLVNPQRPIPYFVSQLTGITNQMVAQAPRFAAVCPDLLDFVGDAVFVAHNAAFDWGFVNREVHRVTGRELANTRLCTVQLGRRLVPGLENYRLHTLAEHYAIEIKGRHRAAGDALATAQIFLHFLALLAEHRVADVAAARRFRLPVARAQRR